MTYKLFTNCIPVKGFSKSIIVDLQRNTYENIPNSLYEILINNIVLNFDLLQKQYKNVNIVNEYKKFLLEKEFIFECDLKEVEKFPKINTCFEQPYYITNAVIEYSEKTFSQLDSIKNSFDNLGVQSCYIVFYENNTEALKIFLEKFDDTRLLSIQVLIGKEKGINYKKIRKDYPRIIKMIIHSSKIDKKINDFIFFTRKRIKDFKVCGVIKGFFSINIETYLESINHNSCLHKKIAIDKDGNIKNCPAMSQSFGNIQDISLEEALNHPEFKKYWNVTKDQIELCKDCEFRHICTDCRAYTERTNFENDLDLSKPLKCGYNPYTNEWEEWSSNPLKQKAIEYYQLQELIKNV